MYKCRNHKLCLCCALVYQTVSNFLVAKYFKRPNSKGPCYQQLYVPGGISVADRVIYEIVNVKQ